MFDINRTFHSNLNSCNESFYMSPFREEVWALPLFALSILNMTCIVCFQLFVFCKVCNTVAKGRNMFLGQILLSGLFLASLTGVTFVVNPDWISCLLLRLGTGVSFAIIFSTLFVKVLFLMSLHDSYVLPVMYQAILLFFAITVQLVIDIQWLVQSPPDIIVDVFGKKQCKTKQWQMLLSLLYIIFLLLSLTVLAVRIRSYRENFRESKYIGGAVAVSVILWITWITVTVLTNSRHFYACMGYGLVCNSIVMFLVMFLPKGRQLASMDHSERSSLNPSSYTPSFGHFYPPSSPSLPVVPHRHMKSVLKSPVRRVQFPYSTTVWHNDIYRPETDRKSPHLQQYCRQSAFNERYSNYNPNVRFSRTPVYIEDDWI